MLVFFVFVIVIVVVIVIIILIFIILFFIIVIDIIIVIVILPSASHLLGLTVLLDAKSESYFVTPEDYIGFKVQS